MTEFDLDKLWSEFLTAWPASRVRDMTLEEYTNADKDDAFIYWVESRLDKLGSIWGGSAFKFGIYCRDDTEAKEASRGRVWGDKYAWLSKFGATEQEAFATIRARLTEVIDAAAEGKFAVIEEIDLAPTLKWKVAFLYQDRESPTLFPIFKKEALFLNYRTIDPQAKLGSTPYHVMYETLMERYAELGGVFEVGHSLWGIYDADRNRVPRAWAVPLSWTLQEAEAIEKLCSKTRIEAEDVDSFLDNLLTGADMSEGDRLALLAEGDVRALATLTNVEPGEFSWDQVPVDFPSGLLVNPTSEVKELDAAEQQDIWSNLPTRETPDKDKATGPRYWKIAPGSNAVAWPEWQERGIVAIGWPKLGDLSGIDRKGFDARATECAKKHKYRKGMNQVWAFRGIQPGDRVIANKGTHTVLGVGTIIEGYRFVQDQHLVDGEDFPHQLKVRWDDTKPRKVQESGWKRTLLELTETDFNRLASLQVDAAAPNPIAEPPAPPCQPQNIILYGPPGTGKTYSTVRRALELILGKDKIEGLSERGLTALFREHQTRGQIEFVTFHQAYGYEEFVEGLRPVLDEAEGGDVRYELHSGVFKRISLRAAAEGLRLPAAAMDFDELWSRLMAEIQEDDELVARSQSGKSYVLRVSSQGNITTLQCEVDEEGNVETVTAKRQVASKRNSKVLWEQRNTFGAQPENLTYQKAVEIFDAGNHYTALWIVYSRLLALSRSAAARQQPLFDQTARVQQALDKPTAGGASFSFSMQSRQFVLIVDEINRGNVSKILGELITLLEPDKRLDTQGELKLPLSYSPTHRFAVPPNLHVLGTMNTADRSIALMDVALRRRFTFEELMPSAAVIREVLRKKVPEKALIALVVDLFETLNARIRFLYDRDHQLGHSYFLDVESLGDLRRVFVDRVIPLLQEYFYGAWDKICIVLGCPYDESGEPRRGNHLVTKDEGRRVYVSPIVRASAFPEVHTLGFDHDEYEDRVDFAVTRGLQDGQISDGDLVRTFLGVLQIEKDELDTRLAELTGKGSGSTSDEAVSESEEETSGAETQGTESTP